MVQKCSWGQSRYKKIAKKCSFPFYQKQPFRKHDRKNYIINIRIAYLRKIQFYMKKKILYSDIDEQ